MQGNVTTLLPRHFPSSYAKGLRYHEQGRVRLLDFDATKATGDVRGTRPRPYRVHVHLNQRSSDPVIHGTCSCPVGTGCKHIVALALAWQARLAPVAAGGLDAIQLSPDPWKEWSAPRRGVETGLARKDEILFCCRLDHTQLFVRPVVSRRGKDGATAGRIFDLQSPRLAERVAEREPDDRAILHCLAEAQEFRAFDEETDAWAAADGVLVDLLVATERLRWKNARGMPLRAGEPRLLELAWEEREDGAQLIVAGAGRHGRAFGQALSFYVDSQAGVIGRTESPIAADMRLRIAALPPVQPEHLESAQRAFATVGLDMLPALKRFDVRTASGHALRARLVLGRPPLDHDSDRLPRGVHATLYFRYDGRELPATDERRALRRRDGDVVSLIARDDAFEVSIVQFLRNEGFHPRDLPGNPAALHWQRPRALAGADIGTWLRGFSARAQAARIDVETEEYFPARVEPELGTPELTVDDAGEGWFEARIGITVDGEQVDLLPLLLHALDGGAESSPRGLQLKLPSGRRVTMPHDRVASFLAILADLEKRKGAFGVPREKLAALVPPPDWRFIPGQHARAFLDEIERFNGLEAIAAPDGFAASLRPYQATGLAWLDFLRRYGFGGVLADDMGLGKTVQLLAFIARERALGRAQLPVLVVCPTSVAPNWMAEAQRFVPGLRTLLLARGERTQALASLAEQELVVTSYALMLRDVDVLAEQRWSLLVLDESQWLKNRTSRGFRAVARLKAAMRVCLTGTPVENHLDELKAQFDMAMPGLLGDDRTFRKRFRGPIERERAGEAAASLRQRLRPFLLRRRKADVASELPPRTSIEQLVELGEAQRDLYETIRARMETRVRDALAERGLARSRITVLDALLKLRQACCDPALVDLPQVKAVTASAKRETLLDLLPTLVEDGRSVLVFSQFTTMLDLIERDLREQKLPFARLDGKTRDRAEPVRAFQAGEVPILLVSLKAGGVGLNLTRADTVILYDPWWNPAAEAQAIDRAHRIGQDKPVFVYQLVCKDTVEERMQALKERKRGIADAVLDDEAQAIEALEAADLMALFAGDASPPSRP